MAYAQLGYPPSADRCCGSSTPGARRRPGRARATPLLRGGPALRSGVGFPQVRKTMKEAYAARRTLPLSAEVQASIGRLSTTRASSLVCFGSGGGATLALALPELACDLRQFTSVYRYVRRA